LDFGLELLTIGHGTRTAEELVETLRQAGAQTLVDVRRFPGSKRNPQFNQPALARALADGGIAYRHAVELGGRLQPARSEPGAERFGCIRVGAFRSYAARMATPEWQSALAAVLGEPAPCLMCAETLWVKCHRRLISELLVARGHDVIHLLGPGRSEVHSRWEVAEYRDGRLYLCGEPVA
jgi:uncharacterized protein (DUF488 family)